MTEEHIIIDDGVLEEFCFIGNKIADKIYTIPEEDMIYYHNIKRQILQNQWDVKHD